MIPVSTFYFFFKFIYEFFYFQEMRKYFLAFLIFSWFLTVIDSLKSTYSSSLLILTIKESLYELYDPHFANHAIC